MLRREAKCGYLVEVVAFKQDDSQTPVGWLADRYFSLDKEAH